MLKTRSADMIGSVKDNNADGGSGKCTSDIRPVGALHCIEVGAVDAGRQAFSKSLTSKFLHEPSIAQVVLIASAKPWEVPFEGFSEGRFPRRDKTDKNQHGLLSIEGIGGTSLGHDRSSQEQLSLHRIPYIRK